MPHAPRPERAKTASVGVHDDAGGSLRRQVGVAGAVLLGLGSILGTGVFVAIALAAGEAGGWVVLSVAIAAAVAVCNGLSSAQLAAAHPVSGGTYAYGYRFLRPAAGFTAGWLFLAAKSASAATAALGLAGYTLHLIGIGPGATRWLALGAIAAVATLVISGLRRSSAANAAIVAVTLGALGAFVVVGLFHLGGGATGGGVDPAGGEAEGARTGSWGGLLRGAALMFVAYTGYGRVATLGEEIREPAKNIPRAVIATLVISAAVYLAVAAVGVGTVGPEVMAASANAGADRGGAAPLAAVAERWGDGGEGGSAVAWAVSIGAVAAMAGVLLNLLLGLSRVALAMGREGDLPAGLARVSAGGSPNVAVLAVAGIVLAIAAAGSINLAWSLSAVTVLVYYGLTNLAAMRMPVELRRYPRWVAGCGLVGCLGLALCIEPKYWGIAAIWAVCGLSWHAYRRYGRRQRAQYPPK